MIRKISLIIAFSFFNLLAAAYADSNVTAVATTAVANSELDNLTQVVKQNTSLNETEKNELSLQLDQAAKWEDAFAQTQKETATLESQINNLAKRQAEITSVLNQSQNQLTQLKNQSLQQQPVDELDKELAEQQDLLEQANEAYLNWDKKFNGYQRLATEGPRQKAEIQKSITQLEDNPLLKLSTVDISLKERVEKYALQSRLNLLNSRLQQLNLKVDRLELLNRYAQQEKDYWSQQKNLSSQIVTLLQDHLSSRRSEAAESELKELAEKQLSKENPLYPLQEQLIKVQQQKAELIKKEKQVKTDITRLTEILNQTKADFARDEQIVELQSSPEAVARLLHKRLESISKMHIKESRIIDLQDEMNEAVLNQLLLSEHLRDVQTGQFKPEVMLKSLPETQQAELKDSVLQLHISFLHAAKDLQSLYPGYISQLSELNSIYLSQNEQHRQYKQFLSNNLLWLPNAEKDSLVSLTDLESNLNQLFTSQNFEHFVTDIKAIWQYQKPLLAFSILLIGLLLFYRRKLVLTLHHYAEGTISIRTDSMLYTLKGLLVTLALALPAALALFALYRMLGLVDNASELTQRLTSSLLNASILVIVFSLFRQSCRAKGLGEKHFKWSPTAVKVFYRELGWAIPFAVIMTLIIGINTDVLSAANEQVIGRFSFILLMLGFIILVYRLWGPNSRIIQQAKHKTEKPGWLQLHLIWFSALLIIPALLIWSTVSGYYYSSILVAERLNVTIGLVLIIFLFKELLLRSIYISERQQQFNDRLKEREAFIEEQKKKQHESEEVAPELPSIDENDINFEKLNRQVKQTINLAYFFAIVAGLWFVWNDLLLALNLISDSNLPLTKSQVIDGVVQEVPLTLGDLLQGLLLGLITLLLAKNLPGILEFTVLKFLPISPAVRYAVSSLTQYLIAIIGFVLIFRALGIEWSNIQWLVAALSVGLGFGLQEIVANFVSGIILLFEQPIRVGDIVTVGSTTGKVSKIRIRATTIVSWDRQELVIPNKDIITGELINWSLSDPISRVRVDVGIAYGADVNKAMQLMMEAAKEHPQIMKDPEPSVIFDSFGDNALLISLRAYVDNFENKIVVKSELNNIINDKMNEAGIVIAFPQRDIHLDTLSPLEIRLTKETKKAATESAKP